MTESVYFDTRAEADAFMSGIAKGGRHEAWIVQAQGKWQVKYYPIWSR